LIKDKLYWERLTNLEQMDISALDQLIYDSVIIKNNIVGEDPTEQGLRKTLNFGHTLGHAIESYFLENADKTPLLHGEAIAVGMILEAFISSKLTGLKVAELITIANGISNSFAKVDFNENDLKFIIELLKYDKKNSHGVVKFVLLESIGKAKIDCEVSNDLILEAFKYYQSV
jgi:3-dehydroquinate synthase